MNDNKIQVTYTYDIDNEIWYGVAEVDRVFNDTDDNYIHVRVKSKTKKELKDMLIDEIKKVMENKNKFYLKNIEFMNSEECIIEEKRIQTKEIVKTIGLKACECRDCGHKFNAINVNKLEVACFSSDDTSDIRCPICNLKNIDGAENARDNQNKVKDWRG